ncbi:hypothetical protein QR680_017720 [Steinernema hermaphroditum]|uniref:Clathrin light chain n=1 Tax=Steinernema hermaphroditum TaxID=289476 RepID=A0AA39LP62_9BILA|nr:hypothetical protein QR680_017720 [Steinernema hermaphroditum]
MADPVADFLAREQDALADLEDESPPTSGADSIGEAPQQAGPGAEFADFNALATGGDSGVDLSALDPASVNIVNGNSSPPTVGLGSFNAPSMPVSNGGSSASLQALSSLPRVEAESIIKWREEQAELLARKDEEEKTKIAEWREQAKKELEEWNKNREETLKKTKQANREHQEKILNGQTNGEGEESANWGEVNRMCEFGAKGNKNTKDTSRLRASYQKMADEEKKGQN